MIKSISQDGVEIKMEVDTEFEDHRLQTLFTKEPETITWISELVHPGEVFFDIGANVGVFSLFAGVRHGNEVKIFSFEPIFHNFEKLCRNLILNNLTSCLPYCLALSDKSELSQLKPSSEISGSASLAFGDSQAGSFKQGIMATTLEDAISKFGLPQPNHIKIDTDGFEENVLNGGKAIFQSPELRSVLIEITDEQGSKQRIMDFMSATGFKTDHPINFQGNHSRVRREQKGSGHIQNIIFTK